MTEQTIVDVETMTKALLDEAIAQAVRLDRNFRNREGTDAIPTPARSLRLLALAVLRLNADLQKEKSKDTVNMESKEAKPRKKRGPNKKKPID